jgi:hypothetical protein
MCHNTKNHAHTYIANSSHIYSKFIHHHIHIIIHFVLNIHHPHCLSQTYNISSTLSHKHTPYDKYTHCLIHIQATRLTHLTETWDCSSYVHYRPECHWRVLEKWVLRPTLLFTRCSHSGWWSMILHIDLIDQGIRDNFWQYWLSIRYKIQQVLIPGCREAG